MLVKTKFVYYSLLLAYLLKKMWSLTKTHFNQDPTAEQPQSPLPMQFLKLLQDGRTDHVVCYAGFSYAPF